MNKTILITGASTGIGKATALFFQEKGWNVIATMRTPEKEEELTQLDHVLVTRLDVTDLDSIQAAVKAGIEKFGKIDVLCNNAGYGAFGPLEAVPRANVVRQFDTNVIGLLDVTQALLPHFRTNKEGVIINISSIGGRMTFPLGSLYHGTKFAVEGITESLNYELKPLGIKARLVEPGAIATDFAGRSFDFQNDESIEEYQTLVGNLFTAFESMMPNASPASLVAEVIYEAATDESDQIRYLAGEDAKMYIGGREAQDDVTFMNGIREAFGL